MVLHHHRWLALLAPPHGPRLHQGPPKLRQAPPSAAENPRLPNRNGKNPQKRRQAGLAEASAEDAEDVQGRGCEPGCERVRAVYTDPGDAGHLHWCEEDVHRCAAADVQWSELFPGLERGGSAYVVARAAVCCREFADFGECSPSGLGENKAHWIVELVFFFPSRIVGWC